MDTPFEEDLGNVEQQMSKEDESIEGQVIRLLEVMRESLSQTGRPKFKDFWNARMKCVELLKMPMSLSARQGCWNEMAGLSKEARKLKDFFDQETSYEIDQIQLALASIEKQASELETGTKKIELLPNGIAQYLLVDRDFFETLQPKLSHLQSLLSQLQDLRRGILSSSIRTKTKTAVLDRSSKLLESMFQQKREGTLQITGRYQSLIDQFLALHSGKGAPVKTVQEIKEEIRILQYLGKNLSITPDAYLQSREQLSRKWDELKEIEAETKEFVAQKRSQQKAVFDDLTSQIDAFTSYCASQDADIVTVDEKHKQLFDLLKTKELDRDVYKTLRTQLSKARDPFDQNVAKQLNEQKLTAMKSDAEQKQKFNSLKAHFEDLILRHKELPLEHLEDSLRKVKSEVSNTQFTSFHSQVLDHLSFQLQDTIQHAKDQKVLNMDPKDREIHRHLMQLHQEKLSQRTDLKRQLEGSKKSLAISGLDFEKAMALREKIETERMSLVRMDALIEQIEEKLAQINAEQS